MNPRLVEVMRMSPENEKPASWDTPGGLLWAVLFKLK
jgi:hypothetical protein